MADGTKSIKRRLLDLIRINKRTSKAIKRVDSEIDKIKAKEDMFLQERDKKINSLHRQERIIIRLAKKLSFLKGKGKS